MVGSQFTPGEGGFHVIGGHTDSPNLKVKTRSKRSAKGSTSIQIGVECYGGGLWHTWLDRDLGISGRVFVRRRKKTHDGNMQPSKIQQILVKIDQAVLRIPNLAIHLQTADERKAFEINKEEHLSPILAMAAQRALSSDSESKEEPSTSTSSTISTDGWNEYQEPVLLELLARELGIEVDEIVDFELNLFDIQKASLGGVHSEFIHSARLDNLASCFLAVQALIEVSQENEAEDNDISMIVLYDHEEVGSSSA